jgi:glycosyltransferase involved in cell wall biosynthesis
LESDPTTFGDHEVDCSVLVPVLNESSHIRTTVAAMLRQRFPGRLEFLFVDGGSDDGTRAILEELRGEDERIRVLENPRRVTPSALNIGLAHARGRWVCRMDAHTEYPEDYIALGVQRLARGDTRWVSGPSIATGHGPVSRAVALALRSPLGRGGSRKWAAEPRARDAEYELDSGVFAGVWARATLLEFGGWDERWTRNQDSEMAGRFLERGETLVCLPAMASRYTPRDSLTSLFQQYFQYGEFRERTARRHPGTMRRSHLLAPSLVACVFVSAVAPRRFRMVARAGLGAYAGLLAVAGLRAAVDAEQPVDAALVPVVLGVIHTAHGAGAYAGALRYGPPVSALARALGLRRLATRLMSAPEAVSAPSLMHDSGFSRGTAESLRRSAP